MFVIVIERGSLFEWGVPWRFGLIFYITDFLYIRLFTLASHLLVRSVMVSAISPAFVTCFCPLYCQLFHGEVGSAV